MIRSVCLALSALLSLPTLAQAADEGACNAAIAAAERSHAVPTRVMGTIGIVESGRAVGRRVVPWPWSVNVEGVGYQYANKADAISAVEAFQAAGKRSIDVGCMQINLQAHPGAFSSLETAFDPDANAGYAARFLRGLYRQSGQLAWAMTAYHSQTPIFAADYAKRLLAVWPEAAAIGLTAEPPSPAAAVKPVSQIKLDQRTLPALQDARSRPVGSSLAGLTERGAAWPR